jgi:hypothetical protein
MYMKKEKLIQYVREKYPIILILLLIGVVLGYSQVTQISHNEVLQEESATERDEEFVMYAYRELDGVMIQDGEEKAPRNVAIMVENNVESWPLSGLDTASVVYEVLAEGRIPRYLLLGTYDTLGDQIGPVRSARPYFLELAAPFDAPYMHVGGSPEALENIKSWGIVDADQFFWSQYFWRASSRFAPHNVYTSQELIQEMLEARELEMTSDFAGWIFKDPEVIVEESEKVDSIFVNYTNSTYQARYDFDPEKNQYQRYQAKRPLQMLDGEEVWIDNVIIEEHKHEVIDAVGRREIEIVGEGNAWIFRDGKMIEAQWKKEGRNALTRYYDEQGSEVSFNRGKTWVNIVEEGSFEYEASQVQE